MRYVLLGAHNKYRFTGPEKFIKIQRWITNPNARDFQNHKRYGEWLVDIVYYDFSLLLLTQPVRYTQQIQPIALPTISDLDYTDKLLITSGWGNTKMIRDWEGKLKMGGASDVPKKVIVRAVVQDARRCMYQGYDSFCEHCGQEEVLCTYGIRRFNRTTMEDACTGDSGGE